MEIIKLIYIHIDDTDNKNWKLTSDCELKVSHFLLVINKIVRACCWRTGGTIIGADKNLPDIDGNCPTLSFYHEFVDRRIEGKYKEHVSKTDRQKKFRKSILNDKYKIYR